MASWPKTWFFQENWISGGEVPKVMGSGWKAEVGGMQWGRSNEKHANQHFLIIHLKKNGLLIFRRSRDFLSLVFLISVVPNPDEVLFGSKSKRNISFSRIQTPPHLKTRIK